MATKATAFILPSTHKLGNVLLTRLRLDTSDLNENKTKLGRSETFKCDCGATKENTEHFNIFCPLFESERTRLYETVSAALETDFQNMTVTSKIETLNNTIKCQAPG